MLFAKLVRLSGSRGAPGNESLIDPASRKMGFG